MATVYLARDLKHDRPVALKVVHPHLAAILGAQRFLREIRLSARLQHPHILNVHESGDADGQLWFTMPYVEGESLRDRLQREKQLPIDDALRIADQVADALHYAHQHGVIHRDIKPENILLTGYDPTKGSGRESTRRAHALVADFGIARALRSATAGQEVSGDTLTETGMTLGTPHYMSPEQAAGERELDQRTDVYSLGCVLYEMLAGEPPFTGPSPQAVLAKRLSEPVPRLSTTRDVPPGIEQAVTRALARAPADRFSTAAEFADALERAPLTGEARGEKPARAARPRKIIARAAPLAAGLLLLLAGFFLLHRLTAGSRAPTTSAAVLPFVDLSPNKDQEYFSDGLTEELITSLSQVRGLRVAARTSSFQFKGRNPDVHEVGRKLDVGAVLEGSVRKSGNRLRVSTQLINVQDGYQLWSASYDRDLADVFAVQEEIARSIVSALRLRLAPGPDSALAERPTADLQAYDLYLKGRFAWNQRTGPTLREAVRYLEQAVARDSGFVRAWAALADAYILVVPYAGGGSPRATWLKAKAAAGRALALDSASAEAYTSLAYGSMIYEFDFRAAEENFQRAIAADSNYPTAHHWYGDFLAGRGRLEESLREFRRAHQLDPLSRQIGVELGWIYYIMRRNEEATQQIRQVLAIDPHYAQAYLRLGLVQTQEGRYADAIASLQRSIELGGFYPHGGSGLALAYARSGDRAGTLRVLHQLNQRRSSGRTVGTAAGIAVAYGALGDTKRGIDWLLRAIEEKDIFVPENFFDPMLDPLRGDPRFAEVKQKMGL